MVLGTVLSSSLERAAFLGSHSAWIYVHCGNSHGLLADQTMVAREELARNFHQNAEAMRVAVLLGCIELCRAKGRTLFRTVECSYSTIVHAACLIPYFQMVVLWPVCV